MIFITLGTQDKTFPRLLKSVEKCIKDGVIKDKVFVQAGNTKYKSDVMDVKDFVDMETFRKCIMDADLIITHGGVGTILEGLKHNKKIIGCARLEEYGEHVNNHQVQLLERFSEDGYIIYAKNLEKFDEYYRSVKDFKPKKYNSNQDSFNKKLDNYICQFMEKEN